MRAATYGQDQTWVGGPGVDRRLYEAAVSHGIDITGCSAEVEHTEQPVGVDALDQAQPWIAQAITLAGLHAYQHDEDPDRVVECQQEAAEHLSDAIVALSSDRMGFADHLTQAQAGWLSCFRLTARR